MSRPSLDSSNRYLLWLDRDARPPVRGSLGKAEEAMNELARRQRLARRRLARGRDAWTHLDALLEARQGLDSTVSLVQSQAGVSRRMKPAKVTAWVQRWVSWMDRFDHATSRHPAFQVLRRLQRQAPDPVRARQLELVFRDLQCCPVLEGRGRKFADAQQQREERYVLQRPKEGGVWLSGKTDGVSRGDYSAARLAAQERGMDGYLFLPWSDAAANALSWAEHAPFRRLLWEENEFAYVPMPAVERMRGVRQAMAEHFGSPNYAQMRFDEGMVSTSPMRLVNQMRRARRALAGSVRDMHAALRSLADAEGLDLTGDGRGLTPWDEHFCRNWAEDTAGFDEGKVFPWRATSLKVFAELLDRCGWRTASATRTSGQGTWSVIHFHIEHVASGRRTHLMYAPFRPHQKGHSYSAGEACSVLGRWAPPGRADRENVVWINQTLDPKTMGFALEDLRVLCHEIGHALHFSALPGHGPRESDFLPEDFTELPSYLLELYHRDPQALARWASPKGPAAARRSRFWVRRLAWEVNIAQDHQDQLRSASVDLLAHLDPARPFPELARQVLEEDGLAMLPEDHAWRRQFIWEDHLAAMDFTQTLPRSLARRLVTVPDHGRVEAQTVASTFRALLDKVLVPGTTPKVAERCWKRWTGEGFATSMGQATVSHARQSARVSRRLAHEVRRKATKRRDRATR